MTTQSLSCIMQHVRKLIGVEREAEQTDGELLEQFLIRRDQSAFATLVRKHGPMVQRVCRRVLGDAHAAEDAFQATFLVLARKATSIRSRASLGGWLYEVAYHLAIRARAGASRRLQHERQAQAMRQADDVFTTDDKEIQAVLDEELNRLPEKYRTLLVLCYLEGKSNTQVAQELGWPSGSMSARLARAREMLRDRLAGRGVALSAVCLAGLLKGNSASAAVAGALIQNTVEAAMIYAAGKTALAGLASGEAVALAEGMLNAMLNTKLKLAAVLLLAVGLLGTGTAIVVQPAAVAQAPAAPEKSADPAPPANAAPPVETKNDLFGDPLPAGALARLGTIRWRHGGPVTFVAYLPGGKHLLTSSTDGYHRVWEIESGKEIRKFGKSAQAANPNQMMVNGNIAIQVVGTTLAGNASGTVALSRDGQTFASSAPDGTIRLYNVGDGKEKCTIKALAEGRLGQGAGGGMVFGPDGKTLFTRQDQTFHIYDTADGKELRTFGPMAADNNKKRVYFGGAGNNLILSPDGSLLATTAAELENNMVVPIIKVWDVANGKEAVQIKGQQAGQHGMLFIPDGKQIAWSSGDGTVRLYDSSTGKEVRKLVEAQPGRFFNSLVIAPDGKLLAGQNYNGLVTLIDMETGKELRKVGDEPAGPGRQLFAISGYVGNPQTFAFAPDGETIAMGTGAGTVRLFEVANGKEKPIAAGHRGGVQSVYASADGKTLITFGADRVIRYWDLATGKETNAINLPAGAATVVFSLDGKMVAVANSNGTVALLNASDGKELHTLRSGNQQIQMPSTLAFSTDSKRVATRTFDGTIHIFTVADGKEVKTFSEQGNTDAPGGFGNGGIVLAYGGASPGIAFTPDGDKLVTISGGIAGAGFRPARVPSAPASSVRIWNLTTRKLASQFETNKQIAAFAVAPDGRTIASANGDGTLSLWEVITGKARGEFKGAATVLAFALDGKTLAAGGNDQKVRVFDVRTTKELAAFVGHGGSILSVAFAGDNKTVISGSQDTTALVWNGASFKKEARPQAEVLDADQLDLQWKTLADADVAKAGQAITALSMAGKETANWLGGHVKPAAGVDAKIIQKMITSLEDDKFEVRQKAADELERLGDLAIPELQKILETQPSLETKQRVDRILERLTAGKAPADDVLQAIRTVEVLENLATPEAKEVLEKIAKGAPGDVLTRHAEAALKRVK